MSRPTRGPRHSFPIRGCHPLRPAVPGGSGARVEATGLVRFRSPLLAESRLMSFPPASEMFQFAGFASRTYEFSPGYRLATAGCPIRRSRDQRLLASPPGLSQRATSFIASQCQGIHQMPLFVARSTTSRPDLPSRANPITTSRKTAAHRGKPQLAASPCEDTFSNGPAPRHRTWRLGARPPRSHSQIHFTLQSTPAPAPAPPADTRPPGRPAPGNDALVFSECRSRGSGARGQNTKIGSVV